MILERQKVFERLNWDMTKEHVLLFLDQDKLFEVQNSVSYYAIGAMLIHNGHLGHPMVFVCPKLNNVEYRQIVQNTELNEG